jgi:hypothetical protein
MDFHHIHMFQPSFTKGYLPASCTKVLGDNSLMISQFGNISTGTSIPGKQGQQTWTSSLQQLKDLIWDFWGFSPAETSTMWAWLSLAAQCSSLTICILQPFATHGKSPLLQPRWACIAIHMIFNKNMMMVSPWQHGYHTTSIIRTKITHFTMSCKLHKTSNDFEILKVAHKQTTFGVAKKYHK